MVPVAGEDSVLDGSAVEGEAHVGASVVDRCEGVVFCEDGDGVSGAGDYGAAAFSEIVDIAGVEEVIDGDGHGVAQLG